MKKFLAMVMTVAMVISMMTVASFAADKTYLIGAQEASYTVAPGGSVDIPIYFAKNDGTNTTWAMFDAYLTVPSELSFEVVAGALSFGTTVNSDVKMVNGNDHKMRIYFEEKAAGSLTNPAFTLKVTVPENAEEKDYSFDYENSYLADEDYMDVFDDVCEIVVPVVKVKAEETKVEGFGDIERSGYAASVSYYYKATKGNHDLIIASYNEINGSLELDKVAITTFEAVGEGTANVALEGATGTVVKAFLWDANMNPVK